LRVLIVSSIFPSIDVHGSLERDPRSKFLYYLCRSLDSQNIDVEVLHLPETYPELIRMVIRALNKIGLLNRFESRCRKIDPANYILGRVKVHRIPVKKIPRTSFYFSLDDAIKFLLNAREEKFDRIVIDYVNLVRFVIKHLTGSHADFSVILHQTDLFYVGAQKNLLAGEIKRLFYRSKHILNKLDVTPSCPAYPLYSGLPSGFAYGNHRTDIKKIIFVGHLRESKAVWQTIRIFEELTKEKTRPLELNIFGDGPELSKIVRYKNLKGLNIKLGGVVSRYEVFQQLKKNDLLIMLSHETFGMVYIEAMRAGCVVVARQNSGMDGIIVDGENGLLLDPSQLYQNVKRISSLMEERALVIKLSRFGLETSKHFSDEALANSFLEYLKND
jgi:glycosyltransferase involved in cell wall biosynthesis